MPTYAEGKVTIGFSKPYVATYTATSNVITYTNVQRLARGVNISIEVESSDASNFYADNIVAETEAGTFTSATATLTVDGLFKTARQFILGLQAAGTDGFSDVLADSTTPTVGVGFIIKSMSNHNTIYTPVVLYKCMFKEPTEEAATQEDEIEWQTLELEANVMRSDLANGAWKAIGDDYSTEAAAETALLTKLGYVEPDPGE